MTKADQDKLATLTHCRFEAKALYNIENTLIVDMDEFLYCPHTHATYKAQKLAIDRSIKYYTNLGYDQIAFSQNKVINRTDDTFRCLRNVLLKNLSIFNCYSKTKQSLQYIGRSQGKSFQIGHKCPLTDVHASCYWSIYGPTIYNDCICSNHRVPLDSIKHTDYWNERDIKPLKSTNLCNIAHFITNDRDQKGWKYWFNSFYSTNQQSKHLQRVADFHRIQSEKSEFLTLTSMS